MMCLTCAGHADERCGSSRSHAAGKARGRPPLCRLAAAAAAAAGQDWWDLPLTQYTEQSTVSVCISCEATG